jgi:membrane protease YdiL (CAAX protease family)
MRYRIIIAIALEVTYAVVTRTWLRQQLDGVHLELAVSAFRVAAIIAYWALFRELIRSRPGTPSTLRQPLLGAGVAVALAIPVVFHGTLPAGSFGTALVFALTSIVVGLREELLYRAVLLNLLQPRLGTAGALLCSTALFVVYHYGAFPLTWLAVTEVSCMSLLLGLVYVRSGSLFTVAVIHSIYDGLWCFGPYLNPSLPNAWRPMFLIPALALVLAWWRFGALQSRPVAQAAGRRPT